MATIDSEKAVAFLNEKWGGRDCPMCGKGPWTAQDRIFQLAEFHEEEFLLYGPVVPVVPVTCGNCGHTVLVNAIVSGLYKPKPQATEGDAQGDSRVTK